MTVTSLSVRLFVGATNKGEITMPLMRDLQSSKAIYAKGMLFVVLAFMSASLIVWKTWRPDVAVLLVICVWASCRAYYFAFYVIEKYVDSEYRFSGLIDFLRYVSTKGKR